MAKILLDTIIRIANASAELQGKLCLEVLEKHEAELLKGAIVTVLPGHTKIRPGDL
jgi:hypothetical protein